MHTIVETRVRPGRLDEERPGTFRGVSSMDVFPDWRAARARAGRLVAAWVEALEARTLLADGIAPAAGPQLSARPGVALTNVTVASFTVTDPSGSPGTKW